jgi:hypothetical protein
MVKLQLFILFFYFLSRPSGTRQSIFHACTSNDVVCDKEVPFMGLNAEKFFRGECPSPDFSVDILYANQKVK